MLRTCCDSSRNGTSIAVQGHPTVVCLCWLAVALGTVPLSHAAPAPTAAPAPAVAAPGAPPSPDARGQTRGVIRVEKVHVEAMRLPPGEVEYATGAAATVLEGERLRTGGQGLKEVLASQAGLGIEQIGGFGSESTLRLRGSSAQQVTWAIDGVPVRNIDGSAFDFGALSLSQLERVEIYRSATPWQLGGQAIGGTVRLLLRQPRGPAAEINLGAGSHGAQQVDASGGWTALAGGVAAVRWLRSRGDWAYEWDGGTAFDPSDDQRRLRRNNDVQRFSAMLRQGLLHTERWALDARYLGHQRDQGLPGAALSETRRARLETSAHDAVLVARGKGVVASGDRLVTHLQLGRRSSEVRDPLGELGPPQDALQHTDGLAVSAHWTGPVWGPMRPALRLGAEAGQVQRTEQLTGSRAPAADRRALEAGIAAPLQWRDAELELLPSVDLTWASSHRSGAVVEGDWQHQDAAARLLPTWRLAFQWQPTEAFSARIGWSGAARTPTLAELFGNDGTIAGHAGLRDERSQTLDAGVGGRRAWGPLRLSGELSAYASQVHDLIGLRRVQAHQARYENISGATLWGGEAAGRALWRQRWELSGWYGALVGRDDSGDPAYQGRALSMRPRTRWGLRLSLHGRPAPRLGRAGLWAALRWQAGHYTDRSNRVAVPPRSDLDLGVTAQSRDGRVRLQVRVDNALNHANFDLVGFPLPGRTLMVTLGLRTRSEQ